MEKNDYTPGFDTFKKGDIYLGNKGAGIIQETGHFMGCYICYKPFNPENDLNPNRGKLKVVDMHSEKGEFADTNSIVLREIEGKLEVIAVSYDLRDKINNKK